METAAKTDRRIARTREAINKAFLELFSEKEFEKITINDIAERANINRGTVYLHYTDKYDLFDKCIDDQLNKMFLSCTTKEKTDLIGALESIFIYYEENVQFFSSMLSNQRTSVFRERMMQVVTSIIKERIDMMGSNKDMDKELIIQFTASAFVGLVEWWISNQMPHTPQIMAEQVWKLFERNDIHPMDLL
ncbi:TetR/AcrR family transcriptional regulator [Niallia sp. 03133]|uniref:TetR/AcrR family transcriptional regulator n=1 Tax=Niallia sp. 03133 TaxID=3458060 RepID=UPI0040442418